MPLVSVHRNADLPVHGREFDSIHEKIHQHLDDLDAVRDAAYDLWIADEGWDVDYFLHENPELKTAPYVWLSDFVGWLPMEDGGEVNKAIFDSWEDNPPTWRGSGGFALHGIDGMMVIPLITIVFLVVSLLAAKQVQGAAQRAGILFVMVALQVFLGLSSHDVVALAPLHALNGFGIFAMAILTMRKAGEAAPAAV